MTFARKTYERKPQPLYAKVECRGTYAGSPEFSAPVAKMDVCRSEPYRRLVAAFPCIHCGIADLSQCAHGNTGKGMGMKTDDRNSFPLCADSPGRPGCHPRFDRHELFPRQARTAVEQAWAADTRRRITAAGIWPATVPMWDETESVTAGSR
jgi:hypothetical protein